MKFSSLLSWTLFLLSPFWVIASNDCQPVTWTKGAARRAAATSATSSNASISVINSPSVASVGNVQPGQVNCRYWSNTYSDVNYYTCTQLANNYDITVELFFQLNPTLTLDCGNIQPNTNYCVRGFIEPLRASNGLCGPPNQNATCLGTAFQCCNAQTWTCGNSTTDCALGTCYEGACVGDRVYSTDGTCGYQHGNRLCAGRWGDCCNMNGTCGTGSAFCGISSCQSGNCTGVSITPPITGPASTLVGNTTDGTCGGANHYICNVVYGNCCNKDGLCGSLSSDCGVGCQPQFGNCSSSTAISSSSTASSTTSLSANSGPSTSSTAIITSSTKSPSSKTISSTTTSKSSTSKSASSTTTGLASLPSCGQTCFNNMLSQYSSLGCATPDPYCLCSNVNFGYGIRDCSNGACGTAVASTVIAYGSAYCSSASATHTSTPTGIAALPSCGQTCFNNMLGQYSSLGCATPDPYCLCSNVNFGYGIRDCSNGACGAAVASTVIAYGSVYCSSASATHTSTPTGIAALPSCGQTCFNNVLGQYSSLGCASPDPKCLCSNINFGYGIRDCSNAVCGAAVASTVISYGSSYCASATAAP